MILNSCLKKTKEIISTNPIKSATLIAKTLKSFILENEVIKKLSYKESINIKTNSQSIQITLKLISSYNKVFIKSEL